MRVGILAKGPWTTDGLRMVDGVLRIIGWGVEGTGVTGSIRNRGWFGIISFD
jgi:hypothetical protein